MSHSRSRAEVTVSATIHLISLAFHVTKEQFEGPIQNVGSSSTRYFQYQNSKSTPSPKYGSQTPPTQFRQCNSLNRGRWLATVLGRRTLRLLRHRQSRRRHLMCSSVSIRSGQYILRYSNRRPAVILDHRAASRSLMLSFPPRKQQNRDL
jgi:hypothetical protein